MSAAIVQRKDLGLPCRGRGFESRWPLDCSTPRSSRQQHEPFSDNRIAVTDEGSGPAVAIVAPVSRRTLAPRARSPHASVALGKSTRPLSGEVQVRPLPEASGSSGAWRNGRAQRPLAPLVAGSNPAAPPLQRDRRPVAGCEVPILATRVRVPPPLPSSSSFTFRSSTTAVRTAVNRDHAGSSPASGAIHESSACGGMRPAATRQSRVRLSDDSPASWPRRLAARTPDSQSGNEGSIPSGVTSMSRSSRGPGRWPFKPETRVRVPHATQHHQRVAQVAKSAGSGDRRPRVRVPPR